MSSEVINLDEESIEHHFKYKGKSFTLREPNMGDLEKVEAVKGDGSDTTQAIEKGINFLEGIGLPKGEYRNMTPRQIKLIMDTITPEKK